MIDQTSLEPTEDLIQRVQDLKLWAGPVVPQPLSGGLSNQSFTVVDVDQTFVVRFGRDFPFHHVFRDRESMSARAAFDIGLAPEVVHVEPGVMVSRFIDARTYNAQDVAENIESIANLVRQFHERMPKKVSGPGFMFWVFHVVRDYANTLLAGKSRKSNEISRFLNINSGLEAVQLPLPVIYGHNDLLPANILDDGERLWLIDFEYAGFSTAMFDLAGVASNSEFDQAQSAELLRCYFLESAVDKVDDSLVRSHMAMQCASLLREAMWSMVSELYLNTPGVDFESYTEENLERLDVALDRYCTNYGALGE